MTMMHEKPSLAERLVEEEYDTIPLLGVQQEFLRVALEQGEQLGYRPTLVKGPHFNDFSMVMEQIEEKLKNVHRSLTPEYVMPAGYRSSEVNQRIGRMGRRVLDGLDDIRNERRFLLSEIVAQSVIPALETQTISEERLSVPPYLSQTKMGTDCVGACFRMVFEGVIGWAPPQDLLNHTLKARYDNVRVDDSVLLGMFQTEAFKAMCDKKVAAFELMGTDLGQIARLSHNAKNKWPDSDVYCTVYQASRTVSDSNILHHNVLLEADGERVVTHDPKDDAAGPFYEQPYQEFADRWAVSYNRAHLIVAR